MVAKEIRAPARRSQSTSHLATHRTARYRSVQEMFSAADCSFETLVCSFANLASSSVVRSSDKDKECTKQAYGKSEVSKRRRRKAFRFGGAIQYFMKRVLMRSKVFVELQIRLIRGMGSSDFHLGASWAKTAYMKSQNRTSLTVCPSKYNSTAAC